MAFFLPFHNTCSHRTPLISLSLGQGQPIALPNSPGGNSADSLRQIRHQNTIVTLSSSHKKDNGRLCAYVPLSLSDEEPFNTDTLCTADNKLPVLFGLCCAYSA